MKPILNALAAVWVLAGTASAEPYFAARKGVSCNTCHVNRSGGFARNAYGRAYGDGLSTFDWKGISEIAAQAKNLGRHLSFSGDIHQGYTHTSKTDSITTGRQAFYLQAYLNEAVAGVVSYRASSGVKEVYGLVTRLPGEGYIKFGTFHPAFGLMLADDRSYMRSGTGFTYDRGENGLEVGVSPGALDLKAAVFNGNGTSAVDSDKQKTYSASGSVRYSHYMVGGSYFRQNGPAQPWQDRWSVYGWGRVGRIVGLGEFARGWTEVDPVVHAKDRLIAAHVSLEGDLGRSVFLRATREFLNPSYAVGDEASRNVATLRLFPVANLLTQIDVEWVQPEVGDDSTGASLDAHVFF